MDNEQILDPAAQEQLVRLARAAIEAAVLRQAGPGPGELVRLCREYPILGLPMGAFITIYVDEQLRGCLGEVEPEDPLVEVVVRCARRSPVYDYRFASVRPDELPALTFKISVLSRPRPVASLEEIQIGTHGLIVRHDGHVGLLLPDVAVEYDWDVMTFLKHLWIKAGIDAQVPVAEVGLWSFTSLLLSSMDFEAVRPKKS